MKKSVNTIANEVINNYGTKSKIKKMEDTIKTYYRIDTKQFREVKKVAFSKIDSATESHYMDAINNVKNGRLSLLDAFKRATKSGKFVKTLKAYDITKDIDYIVNRFYSHVDMEGNALTIKREYAVNEDGTKKKTEDGKWIVIDTWYEVKPITAANSAAIVVSCLKNMQRAEKRGFVGFQEGWNLTKVGRE